MGNTCKPMAVSFQCMKKLTTKKKKTLKKKNPLHRISHQLKDFVLMKSSLSDFNSKDHAFVISKNTFLSLGLNDFFLSSTRFTLVYFTCKPIICFVINTDRECQI